MTRRLDEGIAMEGSNKLEFESICLVMPGHCLVRLICLGLVGSASS